MQANIKNKSVSLWRKKTKKSIGLMAFLCMISLVLVSGGNVSALNSINSFANPCCNNSAYPLVNSFNYFPNQVLGFSNYNYSPYNFNSCPCRDNFLGNNVMGFNRAPRVLGANYNNPCALCPNRTLGLNNNVLGYASPYCPYYYNGSSAIDQSVLGNNGFVDPYDDYYGGDGFYDPSYESFNGTASVSDYSYQDPYGSYYYPQSSSNFNVSGYSYPYGVYSYDWGY